jgi:hypothetical protein
MFSGQLSFSFRISFCFSGSDRLLSYFGLPLLAEFLSASESAHARHFGDGERLLFHHTCMIHHACTMSSTTLRETGTSWGAFTEDDLRIRSTVHLQSNLSESR